MNETTNRALLYGGAILLLGGLGAVMHFSHTDADVMTLLSSADVQLRLAYGMPANDKQGTALTAREAMIVDAERNLSIVERTQPGLASVNEFRGFAQMLRGDYAAAAASYGRASACDDCDAEQRDILHFNQARMLAQAGQLREALAVFGRHASALDARFGHQRRLEEADLCAKLGEREQAAQRLDQVVADAEVTPFMLLQAGIGYGNAGFHDKAESALQRAAAGEPIATYHLARLKLQQGDVDSSLQLLERAAVARPAEVRQLLGNESTAWSAVATTERFRNVLGPGAATPVR